MDSKFQGTTLPFWWFGGEVWGYSGPIPRYFSAILLYLTLFHRIFRYFTRCYAILRYFTFMSGFMISYLKKKKHEGQGTLKQLGGGSPIALSPIPGLPGLPSGLLPYGKQRKTKENNFQTTPKMP